MLSVASLLGELGYDESPHFLRRRQAALASAAEFGHIFRRAKAHLGLQGVYVLQPTTEKPASLVPVVYVCKAADEAEADRIHRLVWNQDVVPFLVVCTPSAIKLYSGFRHRQTERGKAHGLLQTLSDFNAVARLVEDFHADAIDSGKLWKRRGQDVTPEHRVDWKLLNNLRTLDRWLCGNGLKKETSHALIGKYVYLHYLHDRNILSPKKLDRWGIDRSAIFGRAATIDGVCAVVEQLDEWLNGSVFPLNFGGKDAPKLKHLRCVAGVFGGDEVSELGDLQLSLDFQAYDFSYIPIETLSIVYEQFLHAPDQTGKKSRGRQIGAYFTPIPVVNLMLAELEERRPLQRGMRVFDPSCGSGAFLVQCYRRLIENEFPPGSSPKPGDLRDLLEKSIFGVDVEADACNVTELSLTLTLLDYVHPPDLEGRGRSRFQLPKLRDNNIFHCNFFDNPAKKHKPLSRKFDWIVGNPPWKRLNPDRLEKDERPVWKWMKANEKERPVGGNQVARAFAWEVSEYLAPDGVVALFLPAMTLFENPARGFRQAFFQKMKVNTVVNFSNLAEVLAAGRFRVPAASFFYEPRDNNEIGFDNDDEFIRTYSPLVANQETTRPVTERSRKESWNIIINASEIRDIPTLRVADGNGLPWKLATWGSTLDLRLLNKLSRTFPSLRDLEREGKVVCSEGLQLREHGGDEEIELVEEVIGKNKLDVAPLKRLRHVFSFPSEAIVPVEPELKYARKGRVRLPLSVCRPPHVIVSVTRNFAIFHDDFLVVPPRQIGIFSPSKDRQYLKALSLYLASDFVFYHQFLTSTQFGVQRGLATLSAFRQLPIGVNSSDKGFDAWLDLHSRLMKTKPLRIKDVNAGESNHQLLLPISDLDDDLAALMSELNNLVGDSLGLDDGERALVHDLVRVRLALNDGKVGKPAARSPTVAELHTYANRLKSELDDYIDGDLPKRHDVNVVYDNFSGIIEINLVRAASAERRATVCKADDATSRELKKTRDRLRDQRAQWVYFDRNLRIYEEKGTRTYVLKPMQRFHWTESQAMIDAREIIAETIEGAEIEP